MDDTESAAIMRSKASHRTATVAPRSWSPSLSEQARASRTVIFFLYAYAFSAWFNPILNHICTAALVIIGLSDTTIRSGIIRHPSFRPAVFFAIGILALSLRGMVIYPDLLGRQILDTSKWLLLPGFVFLIPWLEGNPDRCNKLLGFALLGLTLGEITHENPLKILSFNIGTDPGSWQPHFQFEPSGITGVAACIGLLGLIVFRHTFRPRPVRYGWIPTATGFTCFYLLGYMLIASQSRIGWLSLLLCLPLAWLGRPRTHAARESRTSPGLRHVLIIAVLAALALGIAKNADVFKARMSRDLAVLSGSTASIDENSSFGLRLKMMEFGVKAFKREPWLGWGNRGTPSIAKEFNDLRYRSPLPDGVLIWFPHLHNTYFEIAVRFGIAGILLFAAEVVFWTTTVSRGIRTAVTSNPETFRLLLFAALILLTLMICALAGFQILQESWRAAFSLSMAISFALSGGELEGLRMKIHRPKDI